MINSLIQETWIDLAISGAKEASEAIMEVYNGDFEVNIKEDRSPVTVADKKSNAILVKHLNKTGIPIISEEEEIPDFSIRGRHEFVWIVDPLDGTKEFIRKNGEFCICIALVYRGEAIFGLLAEPVTKKILIGGKDMGAYYFDFSENNYLSEENRVPPLQRKEKITVAHSRSHFSPRTLTFIEKLRSTYGEPNYIKKGSALKFIDLVLGRADFYPRMAPTMEWDIAAGQAIYESVGGEVLDFTNFEPLRYNKKDLYNPFFIAKNKDLTI